MKNKFVPTSEDVAKIRAFLEENAKQYELFVSLSRPGICNIGSNDQSGAAPSYKEQERRISEFLTDKLNYKQVPLKDLREQRENDLNHGRNGQHRGR